MKVALISTEALKTPPTRYGGIESMVYDLCKGLTEAGIDTTLFACNDSKSPSGKLVEVIEEGWGKTGQCEDFDRIMVSMKEVIDNFDVVHDNSHMKPCWKIHDRVLNTIHWRQHPAQCNYNNVVAISELLANWIRPLNLERDVKVVHHGCDLRKYCFGKDISKKNNGERNRENEEINEEKNDRFLFLSAMTQAKGADIALSIAKDMNLKIDFAGLGGTLSEMIIQESKVNPNICYLGEVTEEQKIYLYQNAKGLIFPTGAHGDWEEPFGLVAIEAMSCGTPVITWNSGAMPEVVVHNRTGFICNSIEEMKNAIRNIDNIKYEDCRNHIEKNFTYQAMAEKYIELYKKLLNNECW